MKNKKIVKMVEKKLKKANKWLQEFKDYDIGHMDNTYKEVNETKELCEMILKNKPMKFRKLSKIK